MPPADRATRPAGTPPYLAYRLPACTTTAYLRCHLHASIAAVLGLRFTYVHFVHHLLPPAMPPPPHLVYLLPATTVPAATHHPDLPATFLPPAPGFTTVHLPPACHHHAYTEQATATTCRTTIYHHGTAGPQDLTGIYAHRRHLPARLPRMPTCLHHRHLVLHRRLLAATTCHLPAPACGFCHCHLRRYTCRSRCHHCAGTRLGTGPLLPPPAVPAAPALVLPACRCLAAHCTAPPPACLGCTTAGTCYLPACCCCLDNLPAPAFTTTCDLPPAELLGRYLLPRCAFCHPARCLPPACCLHHPACPADCTTCLLDLPATADRHRRRRHCLADLPAIPAQVTVMPAACHLPPLRLSTCLYMPYIPPSCYAGSPWHLLVYERLHLRLPYRCRLPAAWVSGPACWTRFHRACCCLLPRVRLPTPACCRLYTHSMLSHTPTGSTAAILPPPACAYTPACYAMLLYLYTCRNLAAAYCHLLRRSAGYLHTPFHAATCRLPPLLPPSTCILPPLPTTYRTSGNAPAFFCLPPRYTTCRALPHLPHLPHHPVSATGLLPPLPAVRTCWIAACLPLPPPGISTACRHLTCSSFSAPYGSGHYRRAFWFCYHRTTIAFTINAWILHCTTAPAYLTCLVLL